MVEGKNIIVLDLETLRSPDDCRHCFVGQSPTWQGTPCLNPLGGHEKIGWDNTPALGLSIGCYYDYRDGHLHWFDAHSLEATVQHLVARAPVLVSFNGISFDFPLMRGLLRRQAERFQEAAGQGEHRQVYGESLTALCDTFKAQCTANSYDILAEIWQVKPQEKFARWLNSLDALCAANNLPRKEMTGALAPRLWAQGRYAEVIAYNVGDVYRTMALFEMIARGRPIHRGDGLPLQLPVPTIPAH